MGDEEDCDGPSDGRRCVEAEGVPAADCASIDMLDEIW